MRLARVSTALVCGFWVISVLTGCGGGDDKPTTPRAVAVTNLRGSTIADASLGEPLRVQWVLPQSYAVQNVTLRAVFTSDSFGYSYWCTVQGPFLSATATSGSLTIPANCGNYLTTQADIYVTVEGVSGERSVAVYSYR